MSRKLVSSGSSAKEVSTHLAINTIGGDFFMEVNMCPWTPCYFLFLFLLSFFFGSRGKCSFNTGSWVCRE